MFETVLQLKPPDQWPPGMTWDKFIAQMNEDSKTPGMAHIFWMPIQTRTEMLTTGFRSVLGIKVFGPDLKGIQNVAISDRKGTLDFPDTRSVFAERTTGGYFLDFSRTVKRPLVTDCASMMLTRSLKPRSAATLSVRPLRAGNVTRSVFDIPVISGMTSIS